MALFEPASGALAATAAPSPGPTVAAQHTPASVRYRVASVTIDVAGTGGLVSTEPERLDGVGARYRFGGGCGTSVSPAVLAQLLRAMDARTPISVRAKSVAAGGAAGGQACITSLVFHAQ
ncbi:MAG: hypothetical protein JKY37_31485 [Nannocystaceae bacterium]|nr:hypothetical protein [Nannocystaceae bacterium]